MKANRSIVVSTFREAVTAVAYVREDATLYAFAAATPHLRVLLVLCGASPLWPLGAS